MNRTSARLPIQEDSVPLAFDTIVWGGLVAGTLDAVDVVIAFGLLGMNPIQVLQFSLLGPETFKGGLPTAALAGRRVHVHDQD